MRNRMLLYVFLIICVSMSCQKKGSLTEVLINNPPVITSVTAAPDSLDWGQTSQIIVTASDPENMDLTYSWTSSGGTFISGVNNDTAVWKAPDTSGTYVCTVNVSDGEEESVGRDSVSVNEHPVLSLDKHSLAFGSATNNLNFNITNDGTGFLDWTADAETDGASGWIKSINPSQGSLPQDQQQTVQVEVDRTGMAGGTYSGAIHISSDGGYDTLSVTMDVAVLNVSHASLDFGTDTDDLTFEITNSGAGQLNWSVNESETWLSVDPANGSTSVETDIITVSVSRTGLAVGTYTAQISVTSDNGDEAVIEVSMEVEKTYVFAEDFSYDLSAWTQSYCTAWVTNNEAHLKGSTSGYYGTLYHYFSSAVPPEYTAHAKMARVDYFSSTDYYGLYTKVNDTGSISFPYYWFTIYPSKSTENWAVIMFMSSGTSYDGWYLLASDSKGYSSLINGGQNQWNEISWTIETDKTLIIRIGGQLLYQTSEISALENDFSLTIGMSLYRLGCRTLYGKEVKMDDVYVEQPSGTSSSGVRGISENAPFQTGVAGSQELPPLPKDISKLPTLREALEKINRGK